jgi:hypothetical protein
MWAASDELQTLQKWAPAKGGPLAFTLTIGMDFINQQAANAFAPTANIFLSVGTVFLDDLSVFSTPPNVLTTQFDAHFIPNFLGTLGEIDGSVSIVDTLSISRALVSSSEDVTISSDVGSYVSKDDLHGHGAGAVLANQFPQKVSLTPSFAIALFYTAASVTNTQVIFNGTFIPSSS